MPRIRSRFANIDPSNEAWTIRISFCGQLLGIMLGQNVGQERTLTSAMLH